MDKDLCRNTHPLVRQLFFLRKNLRVSQQVLAVRAGLHKDAVHSWERGYSSPNLMNYEACLNAMGYDLIVAKKTMGDETRV